jgi:hypothetical protein
MCPSSCNGCSYFHQVPQIFQLGIRFQSRLEYRINSWVLHRHPPVLHTVMFLETVHKFRKASGYFQKRSVTSAGYIPERSKNTKIQTNNTIAWNETQSRKPYYIDTYAINIQTVKRNGKIFHKMYTKLDYRLDDWGSIPGSATGFYSLTSVSRPALRPIQSTIQWVRGSFLCG